MHVGYIRQIRALVGSRPLVLVSAMVIILGEGGRLLMQRRAATGAWHVPGGYLEPGESLEDTARREALEETGLTVGALELVGPYSGPRFHWFAPNGDEVYNVTAAYIAREFTGQPRPDGEEGDALRFFALEELPSDLGPPAHLVLADLMDRDVLSAQLP